MKKLFLIAISFLVAGGLYAGQAHAGISGTPHDLSAKNFGSTQLCVFCHTPHNAFSPQLAPLWNHASTAVAAYTLYSSATLNAVPGQPSGTSKACLSCHDGTVAVDAYGTHIGTTNITAANNLGTDLSNDHPISFTYDAALVVLDPGLVSPASASQVVAGIPLFAGKLECGSCHSVHDNTNLPFLRNTNAGSALCLKCHVK